MMNDIYKNCRWCKHFDGKCCDVITTENILGWKIINLIEDGKLDETVTECFSNKVDEDLIEKICDAVSKLFWDLELDNELNFAPIKYEEFCCKHFE